MEDTLTRPKQPQSGIDPNCFHLTLDMARPAQGWGTDDLAILLGKVDEAARACKAFLAGIIDSAEASEKINNTWRPETVPDFGDAAEPERIQPRRPDKPSQDWTKAPRRPKPKFIPGDAEQAPESNAKPKVMPLRGPGGRFLKKSEQPAEAIKGNT